MAGVEADAEMELETKRDELSLPQPVTRRRRGGGDGYTWTKYSHKVVNAGKVRRYYYNCSERPGTGCMARKTVDRDTNIAKGDMSQDKITLHGTHNHPPFAKSRSDGRQPKKEGSMRRNGSVKGLLFEEKEHRANEGSTGGVDEQGVGEGEEEESIGEGEGGGEGEGEGDGGGLKEAVECEGTDSRRSSNEKPKRSKTTQFRSVEEASAGSKGMPPEPSKHRPSPEGTERGVESAELEIRQAGKTAPTSGAGLHAQDRQAQACEVPDQDSLSFRKEEYMQLSGLPQGCAPEGQAASGQGNGDGGMQQGRQHDEDVGLQPQHQVEEGFFADAHVGELAESWKQEEQLGVAWGNIDELLQDSLRQHSIMEQQQGTSVPLQGHLLAADTQGAPLPREKQQVSSQQGQRPDQQQLPHQRDLVCQEQGRSMAYQQQAPLPRQQEHLLLQQQVQRQQQPMLAHQQPMPHRQQPSPHQQQPVPHQQQPVPDQQQPVPHQQQPMPHQQQPKPHQQQQVPHQQQPMPHQQQPMPHQQQQVPHQQQPMIYEQQHQQPVPHHQPVVHSHPTTHRQMQQGHQGLQHLSISQLEFPKRPVQHSRSLPHIDLSSPLPIDSSVSTPLHAVDSPASVHSVHSEGFRHPGAWAPRIVHRNLSDDRPAAGTVPIVPWSASQHAHMPPRFQEASAPEAVHGEGRAFGREGVSVYTGTGVSRPGHVEQPPSSGTRATMDQCRMSIDGPLFSGSTGPCSSFQDTPMRGEQEQRAICVYCGPRPCSCSGFSSLRHKIQPESNRQVNYLSRQGAHSTGGSTGGPETRPVVPPFEEQWYSWPQQQRMVESMQRDHRPGHTSASGVLPHLHGTVSVAVGSRGGQGVMSMDLESLLFSSEYHHEVTNLAGEDAQFVDEFVEILRQT